MRLFSLTLLSLLASCASIVDSGPDSIPIISEPPGATVYLDELQAGTTPCAVRLDRRQALHTLRLEMDGYKTTTHNLQSRVNGWIAGNILFGGLIGIVIDAIGGNARKFDELPGPIVLEPGEGTVAWIPPAKEEPEDPNDRGGSVVWKNPPPKDGTGESDDETE